jgi:hypothetical protein
MAMKPPQLRLFVNIPSARKRTCILRLSMIATNPILKFYVLPFFQSKDMAYTPYLTWKLDDVPTQVLTKNPLLNDQPTDDPIDDLFDESVAELPLAVRTDLAHQAWIDRKGGLTKMDAGRQFGVPYTTLYDRINGAVSKELANQAMQKLSVAEEEALKDWCLELKSWGWPLRIEQL